MGYIYTWSYAEKQKKKRKKNNRKILKAAGKKKKLLLYHWHDPRPWAYQGILFNIFFNTVFYKLNGKKKKLMFNFENNLQTNSGYWNKSYIKMWGRRGNTVIIYFEIFKPHKHCFQILILMSGVSFSKLKLWSDLWQWITNALSVLFCKNFVNS